MAQRMNMVRVASDAVQGPDSYVVVRKLGYAQRQRATNILTEAFGGQLPKNMDLGDLEQPRQVMEANDAFTRDLLAVNVAAWDWVDDDGQPLPLPSVDPGVVDRLSEDEVAFIVRAIQSGMSEAAAKN
jgi:hypothetical protein